MTSSLFTMLLYAISGVSPLLYVDSLSNEHEKFILEDGFFSSSSSLDPFFILYSFSLNIDVYSAYSAYGFSVLHS